MLPPPGSVSRPAITEAGLDRFFPASALGSLLTATRHTPAVSIRRFHIGDRPADCGPPPSRAGLLAPATMLLRPRLGLRCGPRIAPADHHPRLPAGGNPDSAVSVRCARFHFIAPAPTSRRSAGDPSCIPFLLTSATGSSRDREPMTLVPRPLRGSTGFRRFQASAWWRPRSLNSAPLARWHAGLLHFPQPQELLYFVPPHRPHPLTQDPGALGTPPAPACPAIHPPARFTEI